MEPSDQEADAAAALALDAALAELEETVGDREFVAELIGDFLAGLPAQLVQLRAACPAGELGAAAPQRPHAQVQCRDVRSRRFRARVSRARARRRRRRYGGHRRAGRARRGRGRACGARAGGRTRRAVFLTGGRGEILVVDDDPLNRAILQRGLEREGHGVATAKDGAGGAGGDARRRGRPRPARHRDAAHGRVRGARRDEGATPRSAISRSS